MTLLIVLRKMDEISSSVSSKIIHTPNSIGPNVNVFVQKKSETFSYFVYNFRETTSVTINGFCLTCEKARNKTLTTVQPLSMLFKTRKPLYNATFTTIVL